jgi:hypothetical protein
MIDARGLFDRFPDRNGVPMGEHVAAGMPPEHGRDTFGQL